MFMVSITDQQSSFTFRDPSASDYSADYKFYLQFVRHKCGVSFVEAVADGTVQFDFVDQYAGTGVQML